MTEMSKAALPPRQPAIRKADREHPWFPIYQQYRSAMSAQLVEASAFADWKRSKEAETRMQVWTDHPRLAEFQAWMTANQGGARPCAAGIFPNNFIFWLEGGRW